MILPSTQPLYAYADSNSAKKTETAIQTDTPATLDIPDHQIHLAIVPSSIVNGEWQVTTQGVSMLTPSPSDPVKKGPILFGHDWPVLLGRMRQAVIGQKITLTYGDGKVKTYLITSIFKVAPNHVDILSMAKPDTLLIYTCDGVLDSQRFVVLAQEQ